MLDYALWHGQTGWLFEVAGASQFDPAVQLATAFKAVHRLQSAATHFETPISHMARVESERQSAKRFVSKKFEAVAERQLQPYANRNFKEVLRQCDQFGPDHRPYFNATPLMLAARCGNVPLV